MPDRIESYKPLLFEKDVRRIIPWWEPNVIFDVGANIGQTAFELSHAFPKAKIHSFEPVPKTYDELSKRTAELPGISVHQYALGDQSGTVSMLANGTSKRNKVLPDTSDCRHSAEVYAYTGFEIMKILSIEKLSFLKIDAEGYDMKVLLGFRKCLKDVDFVQVEAAMNDYNTTHIQFRVFDEFFRKNDFLLFKIYDQVFEFANGRQPALRRANPVFIRKDLCNLEGVS